MILKPQLLSTSAPIISATEMTFSLPAPRILYQARTATEWKSCFYNQKIASAKPALKLVDIARDLGLLDDLSTDVDVSFCCMAVIHTFRGQIWAFREAWKFTLLVILRLRYIICGSQLNSASYISRCKHSGQICFAHKARDFPHDTARLHG